MSTANKETGTIGENYACEYLKRQNITVLERNWRCQAGEADIIAYDDDTLVFIEVKTRRSIAAGFPEESVTRNRRRRYEAIAVYYLSQSNMPSCRVRFDVISIIITGEQQVFLKHHVDVFSSGE